MSIFTLATWAVIFVGSCCGVIDLVTRICHETDEERRAIEEAYERRDREIAETLEGMGEAP